MDLSPEELVHHVAALAVQVRDCEDVAAELAAAARQLRYAFDTARRGLPNSYCSPHIRRPESETALSFVPKPTATPYDSMVEVMNWIGHAKRGFAHTTAGQLRHLFPATSTTSTEQWLGGFCLSTLPDPLPADDHAPAVVWTSGIAVGGLLWATAHHEDPASQVKLLLDRVVHKRVLPWEDPWAFRD